MYAFIIYAGRTYRFDGQVFEVAHSTRTEHADYEVRAEFVEVAADFRQCRDVPSRVRRELREKWEETKAAEQAAEAGRAAYAEKCEQFRREAAGSGKFRCSVCGHRQQFSGECEHCGDGIAA